MIVSHDATLRINVGEIEDGSDSLHELVRSENYDAMRKYAVTMTDENQRLQRAVEGAIDILNSYHHIKALGKACDVLTDALKPNDNHHPERG